MKEQIDRIIFAVSDGIRAALGIGQGGQLVDAMDRAITDVSEGMYDAYDVIEVIFRDELVRVEDAAVRRVVSDVSVDFDTEIRQFRADVHELLEEAAGEDPLEPDLPEEFQAVLDRLERFRQLMSERVAELKP